MLIAQISDLHLRPPGQKSYGVVDTDACLSALLAHLNNLQPRPDCVLATGDLTDSGRFEEYAHLHTALQTLAMPCYLLPGNHDDRTHLRAAFAEYGYLPPNGALLYYTLEHYPIRIIALDTVVPQQPHGELGSKQLDWLAARLAEQPHRPTVIAMHHPPFATGLQPMDALGLRAGGPELASIVQRYPNVERILCGHLHRTIFCRFGGTLASTCPAPAHQIALDLASTQRLDLVMEPPGYHLHTWQAGTLVTHHVVVGDYPHVRVFSGQHSAGKVAHAQSRRIGHAKR